MSFVYQLPPQTEFFQPLIRFTATFNVPTVNRYDFNVAANTDVAFQRMEKNHLYLIDAYSFSATVEEAEFFKALEPAGTTVPTLSVRIPSQTNRQIHPNPIPLVNYVDGMPVLMHAHAQQTQQMAATFRGSLAQTPAMGAPATITAQVQFNIYEIRNLEWIELFLGRVKRGVAPLLNPGAR